MDELDQYKNPVHSMTALTIICAQFAKDLEFSFTVDKINFLLALSAVESSFAQQCGPRFEPAFAPQGKFFNDKTLRTGFETYGCLASSSFGPWQILWINCKEMGFNDHPLKLMRGSISAPLVVQKLNHFASHGSDTLEKLLSCWNSGGFDPQEEEITTKYVIQFKSYYEQLTTPGRE